MSQRDTISAGIILSKSLPLHSLPTQIWSINQTIHYNVPAHRSPSNTNHFSASTRISIRSARVISSPIAGSRISTISVLHAISSTTPISTTQPADSFNYCNPYVNYPTRPSIMRSSNCTPVISSILNSCRSTSSTIVSERR